jgi:CheY-like chemotaxis protein
MDPTTLTVLIVSSHDATDLADAVRRGGHDVRVAGDSAPDRARAAGPDVILLDLGRPVPGVFDIAARLAGTGWPRHPLVVGVDGRPDTAARDRAAAARIDLYLASPVDTEALLALLTRYAALLGLARPAP